MEIDWKKVALITEILFLVALIKMCFTLLHNIDLSFNLWRENRCDWVSKDICVNLREMYIQSMGYLEKIIILIPAISILIGYTIYKL